MKPLREIPAGLLKEQLRDAVEDLVARGIVARRVDADGRALYTFPDRATFSRLRKESERPQ